MASWKSCEIRPRLEPVAVPVSILYGRVQKGMREQATRPHRLCSTKHVELNRFAVGLLNAGGRSGRSLIQMMMRSISSRLIASDVRS